MAEATVKTPQRPKLMIRRGKKVTEGVEVKTVFSDIKTGRLRPSDEFSMDGENWRRLDTHVQLAKVFAEAPQKPRSGKKGILTFLFLVILVALGGLFGHPYLAFYKTQIAADGRNVEKFSQWVDYQALRQDIKEQADAQWNAISSQEINKSPYAKSALPLGRKRVDQWTDTLVTPEAVMDYSKGKTEFIGAFAGKRTSKGKNADTGAARDPFANLELNVESAQLVWDSVEGVLARAELRYQDVNTFVATLKADNGENFVFRFERRGMDWKVAGIHLPAGPMGASVNGIARSALKQARNKARAGKRNQEIRKINENKKKQAEVAKLHDARKAYMANLELRNLSVGKGKKYLFGGPNPGIFATLMNKGNRTLKEVEITIYFFNRKGAIASEKKLYPVSVSKYRPGRDNDPLGPHNAKKVGYLVKDFAPTSWAGKVQMRVTHIVLSD